MPKPFHRTEHFLHADRGLLSIWMLLVGVGLGALWMLWAFSARVTMYEVSDSARLEVTGAAAPVEAEVSGEVSASYLVLGQTVQAGSVLLELQDRDQQLALRQEETRREELSPQLTALKLQAQSEEAGKADEAQVLRYATGAAEAQLRQAQSEADLAAGEAHRAEQLRAQGLIAEAELQKAEAEAKSKIAAADVLKQQELRLSPDLDVRNNDRTTRQREVLAAIAKLEADLADSNSNIQRLRFQIERRKVRAPLSGRLTECAVLHAGAHIGEGQQVGVILPFGKVQMIAEFDPSAAFGRLHTGQRAKIRLNAFPWAQFGVLQANVSRVAGEIRDGKVRVELALSQGVPQRIPLQHGLPGTVEVEVERVTPAAMLLRSAGQVIGAQ